MRAKTQPKEMMVFTTTWEAKGANEETSVTQPPPLPAMAQGRTVSSKMSTPVLLLTSASKPREPKATQRRGSRVAATYGSENWLPGAHYFSKALRRWIPCSTQYTLLNVRFGGCQETHKVVQRSHHPQKDSFIQRKPRTVSTHSSFRTPRPAPPNHKTILSRVLPALDASYEWEPHHT